MELEQVKESRRWGHCQQELDVSSIDMAYSSF